MADNVTVGALASGLPPGTIIGARTVTYSGDANVLIAPSSLVSLSGSDDAKTATDVVLPTALGANGGIKVDIVGDTGTQAALDDDDGSIANARTNIALTLGLPYTYNGGAWARGGLTPYKLNSAASTNATSVKASAGTLGAIIVTNINAAVRYLKFYNKASSPTVGTDTPVLVFAIPGNTAGAGIAVPLPPHGFSFTTGIAFALTTGAADSDTGAVAANEQIVNLGYL